ncbi:hypothetical protein BgiMline_019489, partial [Biomphalaria glabrata]
QLSSKVLATQYLITRMFINYWWVQGFRNLDCNHTKLTSDKKDVTVVGTFDVELVMYDLKPGGDYNSHEQLMRLVFPFYFIGLVCFTTQAVVQDKKSGAKVEPVNFYPLLEPINLYPLLEPENLYPLLEPENLYTLLEPENLYPLLEPENL